MTHVTCRLTAKYRDHLWNPTLVIEYELPLPFLPDTCFPASHPPQAAIVNIRPLLWLGFRVIGLVFRVSVSAVVMILGVGWGVGLRDVTVGCGYVSVMVRYGRRCPQWLCFKRGRCSGRKMSGGKCPAYWLKCTYGTDNHKRSRFCVGSWAAKTGFG